MGTFSMRKRTMAAGKPTVMKGMGMRKNATPVMLTVISLQ